MQIINGVRYTDQDAKLLGLTDGIESRPAPAPEALAGALHAAKVAAAKPVAEVQGDEPTDDGPSAPESAEDDGGEPETKTEDEQPPADESAESAPAPDGGAKAEEGTDGAAGEPERPRAARRRTK